MAMAFYNRNGEKKKIVHDFRRQDEEVVRSLCRYGMETIFLFMCNSNRCRCTTTADAAYFHFSREFHALMISNVN